LFSGDQTVAESRGSWGAGELTGSGRSQAGWVVGRVVAGKGAVGVVVLVVPHDGGGEERGRGRLW
jgi:hypothetical protein